jgi:hypothetical protein
MSAELSTPPLRRRPAGRSAAAWITSESVSGGQPAAAGPDELPGRHQHGRTDVGAAPVQTHAASAQRIPQTPKPQ